MYEFFGGEKSLKICSLGLLLDFDIVFVIDGGRSISQAPGLVYTSPLGELKNWSSPGFFFSSCHWLAIYSQKVMWGAPSEPLIQQHCYPAICCTTYLIGKD